MTRVTAVVISVVPILIAIAGCAARGPGRPGAIGAASPGGSAAATAKPSIYSTMEAIPAGGQNPQAAIPNPGTGTGDPLLVRALLPQSSSRRVAVLLLPPAVVALPDRERSSLFIGLRQYSSPVIGPQICDGWTAGLWMLAVTSFNQPGVQLAVTEQSVPTPAGLPSFSEAIIAGPPSVLNAMDSPLPSDCRTIASQPYSGGVRPIDATAPGPGSRRVQAFEVTGTGKVPVWQWVEVVRGPDFLLEIRIPNQSADADPGAALATITASAYSRAAAVLSLFLLEAGHDCPARKMPTPPARRISEMTLLCAGARLPVNFAGACLLTLKSVTTDYHGADPGTSPSLPGMQNAIKPRRPGDLPARGTRDP